MVKSMKKVKRIIAVALVFTMLFASQVTVFAAGTKMQCNQQIKICRLH